MKLKVLRRYRNAEVYYREGDVVEVTEAEARWLMSDSPGTFEPAETKGMDEPPANRAILSAPETKATDAARELAAEHGIDLDDVEGTGDDGRVLKGDVAALIDEE